MRMYVATQIHRLDTPTAGMTEWRVDLDAGRAGRVQVPLDVFTAIEATDPDAYAREALADHLTQHQVPEAELLAGRHVAAL